MFRQKERKEQKMYMYMLCSSPVIHTLLYISNQKRGEIPCQVQIKYTHTDRNTCTHFYTHIEKASGEMLGKCHCPKKYNGNFEEEKTWTIAKATTTTTVGREYRESINY